jgi:adenylate cyclase
MDVTVSAVVNLPDETSSRRVRTAASIMNEMTYGVSDRLSTTDDILAWDLAFPKFRDQDDECLYGLMDTIPSRQTPDIEEVGKKLHDSFQSTFLSELSKKSKGNHQPDEITSAIRSTFLTLQRDVMAHCSASTLSSTSMTIMYLKGSNLYSANVGDVQALLGQRGGRFKVITQLHVPGLPNMSDEITRIRQTGGYVSNDGFVNGEFSLSRCFGAFSHLPTINANPHISCIPLSGHDEFIIMAGRGIWEVISHEMAINIVRMAKRDYMIAAQKIKDLAVAYGAKRHIMVMIIGLNQLAYLRRKPTRKIKGHKIGPGFSIDLPSFDPSDAVGLGIHKSKKSRKPIREEDLELLETASMKREIEAPTGQLALVMTDIKNSTNLWEIATRGMEEGIKRHNKVMRHYLDLYGGYEVKTEGDAFIVSFPTVTSALLWCMTTQLELLKIEWPSEILATDDGREILDPDSENRQVLYKGLSVRMGMNFGSPLCDQNIITGRMDYYGPMVNRASRISSAADGGELCISSDVVSELMTIPGLFDFEEDGPKSSSPEIAEKQLGQLDEKMQQEIIGLKKLGLRLICLGEKKLKGLETPETLYMVIDFNINLADC